MIGVLVAHDPRQAIGRQRLVGPPFFKPGDLGRPGDAAFDADLDFGLDSFGLVQAADGNVEVVRPLMGEGQGRAAGRTEAPVDIRRTLEDGRSAPGPGEILLPAHGQRRIAGAKGLLAHAAVADMRAIGFGSEGVSHGAALAAAAVQGSAVFGHGDWVQSSRFM